MKNEINQYCSNHSSLESSALKEIREYTFANEQAPVMISGQLVTNTLKTIIKLSDSKKNKYENISHRIIADHIRSSSHLIADGILPSNEGRGYVLRRIMRRGMRHAHILGCKEPIFYKLSPIIIKEMGDVYPELKRAELLITETLKN